MTRVPALTSREFVAALRNAGYYVFKQSGSHLILKHDVRSMIIVPMHSKDLHRGLMLRLIKSTGMSESDFIAHLK